MHRIATPAEFTAFVSSVNTDGASYSGTTVYLDSDLTLSGPTDPIGISTTKYFQGVFDGQGHTISNLNITSTSEYASLFGYSTGMSVRNVVLDESCSIVGSSNYSAGYTYVAGFVGNCSATTYSCSIENNVNLGSVAFNGVNRQLRLGGIAGILGSSASYTSTVRNCVNYGPVTHSGTNNFVSNIGGIVSAFDDTEYSKYIQNCANYGTITHSGTTSTELRIGGIVGYSKYASIGDCVSAGRISVQNEPSSPRKGSLAGYASSLVNLSYCYFTTDVGVTELYGGGSPTMTGTPTSASAINSTLLSNLNTQAIANGWNSWLLNTNKAKVTFKVNDYKGFSLASQLVLRPDLAVSGNNSFRGWFTDASHSTRFDSDEVSGQATTLYGLYEMVVTVTFDGRGGVPSQSSKDVVYNREYGTLPSAGTRTGHTFAGWFTEADGGIEVTSETKVEVSGDHTLYAQWTINNYTITFVFNNGTEPVVRTLDFDETIVYPENVTKEGHTFAGWSPKPLTMPAQNITVTAQWIEKPSEYVEIVFAKKDLEQEQVKEILQAYTQEEIVIEKFVKDEETGEVKVIVKFVDQTKAVEFIRKVNEVAIPEISLIKRVNVASDYKSFSLAPTPFSFLRFIL